MKTIKKTDLDILIDKTREMYSLDAKNLDSLITDRIVIAKAIAEKNGLNWLSPIDLIDCIMVPDGLKEDASNEEIYQILNLLGWGVA